MIAKLMRCSALALLACAGSALAQDKLDAKQAEAMMEKYACSACHQLDAKVLGPSWKEVAAKYKDNKDAPAKLADAVRKGSSGVWGPVPMPANAGVSEADAKALVGWILAQ